MPRIWYEQGFRFSFFSSDGHEPPHVHVRKGGGNAKWWLDPVSEARSTGFRDAERRAIRRIVRRERPRFLAEWRRFFGEGE